MEMMMAEQAPKFSERLWSEEVAQADAANPLPPHDPGYEFSNGRKFRDGLGPYAPLTTEETPQ
jgi:hypothetical protein